MTDQVLSKHRQGVLHQAKSSGSDEASSSSAGQDEIERLKAHIQKLERQNRHLLKQQKIHQTPRLTSSSSIIAPNTEVDSTAAVHPAADTMSISSSIMTSSKMMDDSCSIISTSDIQPFNVGSSVKVQRNPSRSQQQSSHQAPISTTLSKDKDRRSSLTTASAIAQKYSEDSWLYRLPSKKSLADESDLINDCVGENNSLQWIREVFDSPKNRTNTDDRDLLVKKLDELRLTGKVSRWKSVAVLSPSPASHISSHNRGIANTTDSSHKLSSTNGYGSNFALTNINSQEIIVSPSKNLKSNHSMEFDRRESLPTSSIHDVMAIARQQQDDLKAAHAMQRSSRSRSRPGRESATFFPDRNYGSMDNVSINDVFTSPSKSMLISANVTKNVIRHSRSRTHNSNNNNMSNSQQQQQIQHSTSHSRPRSLKKGSLHEEFV